MYLKFMYLHVLYIRLWPRLELQVLLCRHIVSTCMAIYRYSKHSARGAPRINRELLPNSGTLVWTDIRASFLKPIPIVQIVVLAPVNSVGKWIQVPR